jgi:RimJ/RimL family protein N-acetyltransferase
LLRRLTADDIPSLVRYTNNKKISDHVLNIPFPYGELDAVARIRQVTQALKNKSGFPFCIVMKETNEMVGEVSLHLYGDKVAQLAFWIGEPFWNAGIATEAVKAVVDFGMRDLKLEAIFADCNADNTASQKVAIKSGMKNSRNANGVLQYVIRMKDSG